MAEVMLHVYDVTNSMNVRANTAIMNLNKLMRDGIGLGGIFHGAVQVFDEEWSFGFCENGSGVFSCLPKENPMYTYRESVPLGRTELSVMRINQILAELSREWPGCSYDLLSRNCNHFCEELCTRLGVQKLPLWVNRFANAGDAAVEVAGNTMERLRQAKTEVMTASRVAMRFLLGAATSTSLVSPDPGSQESSTPPGNSSRRIFFARTPSKVISRSPSMSTPENGAEDRPAKQGGDPGRCVILSRPESSFTTFPS